MQYGWPHDKDQIKLGRVGWYNTDYRSLNEVIVPLGQLNLITGPNGSGKSSLYRSLRLLADAATGRLIPSLAREGGLQSTLWAGIRICCQPWLK